MDYPGGGVAMKWAEDKDQELGFEPGKSELLIDTQVLMVNRPSNSSNEGEGQ